MVDSSVVSVDKPVLLVEDTEAFETDESAPTPIPSPRHRTARMSVRPQIPMLDTTEVLIAEYTSALTPPSPPLMCKMGGFSLRDWYGFGGDYNQFKTL
ncbi:hypothetical protein Tco_0501947 [Tanacetum coccineum]